MKQADILNQLSTFTGTENYFKIPFSSLVYTDGVKELINLTSCNWLISDISILISNTAKLQKEFLILEINVNTDKSCLISLKEDSDLKPIYTQVYNYTDFPLSNYSLYIINNIMLLMGEY